MFNLIGGILILLNVILASFVVSIKSSTTVPLIFGVIYGIILCLGIALGSYLLAIGIGELSNKKGV
jgi:hypothetical protein